MNYCIGDIVKSLSGHDKGKAYIVVDVRERRVLVADGEIRSNTSPKEKNPKHLTLIGKMNCDEAEDLVNRTGRFSVPAGTTDKRFRDILRNAEL